MRIGRTSSRSGRRSSIGLEDSGLLMQRACAFQCHLGNSVFASSERDAAARTELVCRTGFASGRLASRGISRRLSELATAMAMRPSATRARQGRTLPAESWKSASHARLVRAVALTDRRCLAAVSHGFCRPCYWLCRILHSEYGRAQFVSPLQRIRRSEHVSGASRADVLQKLRDQHRTCER